MEINQIDDNIREKMLFIKKFCSDPRSIGSIAPSSPYLTESILSSVKWEKVRTAVEFGAGTGVFTTEIIKRIKCHTKLYVFEKEPELRRLLQVKTGLNIYSDAVDLSDILESEGLKHVDLIISSLPYTVLPKNITDKIINGIIKHLDPKGSFIAYQYSLHMKESFENIFNNVNAKFVLLNFPPAFVYECTDIKDHIDPEERDDKNA
ncbi:MAG TPA: methyltransferase type 11 [Synergistaceae bacterium]|nr:methyltransferase type 11 [Synergistaceae bacterium]